MGGQGRLTTGGQVVVEAGRRPDRGGDGARDNGKAPDLCRVLSSAEAGRLSQEGLQGIVMAANTTGPSASGSN